MESQTLINILGGAALSALGWFGRVMWEAVAELRKDIHEVEIDLPKNYVRRDEYSATMVRIEDMFQRIFDKLDNKLDK